MSSLIKRIENGFKSIFNAGENSNTLPDWVKKTKNGHQFTLKNNRVYRYEGEIADLDKAIILAQDSDSPSRIQLYTIYRNLRDLHVKSQMRTAIFSVVREPWIIVDENLKPDKEATKLMQRLWFHNLNKYIIENEFYGHTLVYFKYLDNFEIDSTNIIPRIHVLPERSSIIPDLNFEDRRFRYDNDLFKDVFIEVGEAGNLGLLEDVARWCILKWFSVKDWSRSSEKWGDPHLVIRSASDDDAENDKKADMAANFGHNGWLMVDADDEIDLLERSNAGTSHNVFLDFLNFSNEENSKGINGQTATSDQKSFVGSAEVQERILDAYTESRLTELMFFHNETTLPFLININNGNSPYSILKNKKWMPVSMLKDDETDTGKQSDPVDSGIDPKNNPFG